MGKKFEFLIIASSAFIILFMTLISLSKEKIAGIRSNLSTGGYLPMIEDNLSTDKEDFTIMVTGDVMLGRAVMSSALDLNDPAYPFRKVGDLLRNSNLAFINLENPIVENCPKVESGFKFCASPELVQGLEYSGVDVINLANNHSGNYGSRGIEETRNILEKVGIEAVGLGDVVVKKAKDVTIGFLGFDFTVRGPVKADFELINSSKKMVDKLFVGVHWGQEYKNKANENQRRWGKEMIENGADIVIGHHPHWVQDSDCYTISDNVLLGNMVHLENVKYITSDELKSNIVCPPETKAVYYSLGNFIFDQMWSEETKKGIVLLFNFSADELKSTKVLPIYMRSNGQPEFVRN